MNESLKSLNSDYESKRSHDLVLELLDITVLKNGTFDQWLKSKGKLGGQNKVPRLANTREYVDQILEFSKECTFE